MNKLAARILGNETNEIIFIQNDEIFYEAYPSGLIFG
jgi:hypothetical protein